MTEIHPQSCVDPSAELADDVVVGFNCFIGPHVRIDKGCVLHNNVTIIGYTTIGPDNVFFPNATIGAEPQDLKYRGSPTSLDIGAGNTFRENVTVHLGTETGGGVTRLGNGGLYMAGVHVGHDSMLGNNLIIANNAMLGGHVMVEDNAVIGGGAGIAHMVTIGRQSMIGGLTRVVTDVPPFMIFEGNPGAVRGINVVGMQRAGFSSDQIDMVRDAYRTLYRRGTPIAQAIEQIEGRNGQDERVAHLIAFIRRSQQGKHGRYQELTRKDTPEDLPDFYRNNNEGASA